MARRVYPLVNGSTTISDALGSRTVSAVKDRTGRVVAITPVAGEGAELVKRLNAYQCHMRTKKGKRSECCA